MSSDVPEGASREDRLAELENRYLLLEKKLPDPGVREAVSVLHGMIQEALRRQRSPSTPPSAGFSLEDIRGLYKKAPGMQGPAECQGLSVGARAPDFSLPDAGGREIRLSNFRGKLVLLVFYPLDWSPGCSVQLDLYQSELAEFQKRGIQVLAISVDSVYSHGAWAAVRGIGFPLLADFRPKGTVAQEYRVLRSRDGFSERALYLIDGGGIIRYSHVSPYIHHVPDIEAIFSAADALKQGTPAASSHQA